MKNIKKNLPINERILFFNSMIKPVTLYGSTVWDSCSRENIQKISKLQKRAARVIFEARSRESSDSLFKQFNCLTISDEMKIRKCCLICKRINSLTPNYIDNILVWNVDTHSRSTRHSHINLVCFRYKRESEGVRSFQVSGTKLSNTLPANIRKKESYNSFYRAIRTHYYTT